MHERKMKRTQADLLGGATQAYADHHEHLRTVAKAAGKQYKQEAESAEVAYAIRQSQTGNDPNTNRK